MITHYGYIDGSGEYFIVIDSDKCSGCQKCVQQCPQQALEMVTEFVDLEDKNVAAVSELHRKKIRYTCAPCKPQDNQTPCVLACEEKAISCVWKPL
ncbi:MAG: 4Fe-4S binding protein [Candidatus Bathyarchaeota archaeon]|nr:4Fe-4S binding protein [Candidatus Bathyarchaeota archaeon]